MKLYQVYDNGSLILSTYDKLKALETYYTAMQKHQQVTDWGWIDNIEIS